MSEYEIERPEFEILETGQYKGVIISEEAPAADDEFKYHRFLMELYEPKNMKGTRITLDFPAKVTIKTRLGNFLKVVTGVDLTEYGKKITTDAVIGKKIGFDAMQKSKDKKGKTIKFNEFDNFKLIV